MGRGKRQGPSGAGAPAAHLRVLLTFALSILKGVARLTGESLVAAEGTYGVHAVLAPAACVQVRHTLVDVCRESASIRYWGGGGSGGGPAGRGVPGPQGPHSQPCPQGLKVLAIQRATCSCCPPVYGAIHSTKIYQASAVPTSMVLDPGYI